MLCFVLLGVAHAEPRAVLVTVDGLRWQEAFHGPDPALVTRDEDRQRELMPFLASFARDGVFIGDRRANSCMRVENKYWFSYPGYTEMLAGRPNPRIGANARQWNDDVTVLEWLNGRDAFRGQVRIFAEWGKVPYILNTPRSGLPVVVAEQSLTLRDPPTMAAAHTIFTQPTRVAWIDLGDTDTRAHDGDYPGTLDAAAHADAFLADLWAKIEAHRDWAGQTTLIVTVDHGRGDAAEGKWRGHGSGWYRGVRAPGVGWAGSDATWLAARGPTIAPGGGRGYAPQNCATTAQVAATLVRSVGEDPAAYRADVRPALDVFR